MNNLLLILLCLGLGIGLQQALKSAPSLSPEQLARWLNRHVLWLALPALTLVHISPLQFSWQMLLPASVAWLVFGLAWLWVHLLQSRLHWDKATTGCLLLTCGLGNTSFVGFPLIQWLYGPQALPTALLVDQPGSFLVLSTLGLLGGAFYAGQTARPTEMLWRVLSFPPFIAFGLALLRKGLQWPPTGQELQVLQALGASLTPAALLAVGLQLKAGQLGQWAQALRWGLSYRLGLAPLLMLLLYAGAGLRGEMLGVMVLEAGMAPMITGAIVASSLGLQPALAQLMVSTGIVLSLLTIPLWYGLLQASGLG